jgi:hypothetical protein
MAREILGILGCFRKVYESAHFMALANPFIGLDSATLTTLKTQAVAALSAILTNQSYSLNGRSVTRANLNEVKDMVGQLQSALDISTGNTAEVTYIQFNSPNTW